MNNDDGNSSSKGDKDSHKDATNNAVDNSYLFRNPVVVIAMMILLGVFALLGAAIVGWDHHVLLRMSNIEFARGLITYLFAVVTIGTAVVLVVSALVSEGQDIHQERFQRGKEILSLLLGIFGTIVGFYFGREAGGATTSEKVLYAAPIHVSSARIAPNGKLTVSSFVYGGNAPYRYEIKLDDEKPSKGSVQEAGWLNQEVVAGTQTGTLTLTLTVEDADGHTLERKADVTIASQ